MIDPIWKQAPEGTTHRNLREQRFEKSWRRVVDGQVYYPGEAGGWEYLCAFDASEFDYDERPEEPEPVAPNLLRIPADIVPPPGATRVAFVWGRKDQDGGWELQYPNQTGAWHHTNFDADTRYNQDSIDLVGEQPAPEWDGVGIPPVGTICLCDFNGTRRRVEIVGEHGKYLWAKYADGILSGMSTVKYSQGKFEPYLTEDQKIAKARKEDIDEICRDVQDVLDPYNANIDCSVAMRATVEALYDKGYFKGDDE